MKKLLLSIAVLGVMSASASEVKDYFGSNFVVNCYEQRHNYSNLSDTKAMAICQCAWNKIAAKYSDSKLIFIDEKATENSKEFLEFTAVEEKSGEECYKQIQRNSRF